MLHKLVGGFNPSEKYESNWESSRNRGENINYLKPPPRKESGPAMVFQNELPNGQAPQRSDGSVVASTGGLMSRSSSYLGESLGNFSFDFFSWDPQRMGGPFPIPLP